MNRRDLALGLILVLAGAAPATAHHPGADLDRIMGSKEKYFQLIDKPAPAFQLMGTGGERVSLADFADISFREYLQLPDEAEPSESDSH